MKLTFKLSALLLVLLITFGNGQLFAQTAKHKTEQFKVYGNCGMCKETIESALKKKEGISKKNWDKNTKMISVTFDESKLTLLQIKQKLADVGYDTDALQAKDEVYNNLPDCCKYERAKK